MIKWTIIIFLFFGLVGFLSQPTNPTKENIKVEICSKCHPFFTGKQKLVDTAGRVDRFRKKYAAFNAAAESKK